MNSGLSDRPQPLNLDGTPFRLEQPPPPEEEKTQASGDDKKGEDSKAADKPGVSKEKSALGKAKKKK